MKVKYLAVFLTLSLLTTTLLFDLFIINEQKGNSSLKEISKIAENISNCSHENTQEIQDKCYHQHINKNLSLPDIKNIITKLNQLRSSDQQLNIACHQITHIIGAQAYQKHQNASLMPDFITCQEGYYHGVMSEVIKSTDNYLEKLKTFCSTSYHSELNDESWENNICYHGIGHALGNNAKSGNNLPFYQRLVSDCDLISKEDQMRAATCFDGGLTEYHLSSAMSENDCSALPKKYIKTCYRILYHMQFISQLNENKKSLENMVEQFTSFDQTCLSANQQYIYRYEKLLGCKGALSMAFLTNVLSVTIDGKAPIFATLNKEELTYYYNKICGEIEKQECLNLFIDYANNINSNKPVKRLT